MIDLSQHLELAQRGSDNWSPDAALELLKSVSQAVTGSSVDFDFGTGEKWGRVLIGDKALLIVCSLLPIAFVDRSIQQNVACNATSARVETIVVEDMDQKRFSVGREDVERIFHREMSHNLDFSNISANELWWASV